MNVLFLSLGKYWSMKESEGYTDLLREFIRNGHKIYVLSPIERREGKKSKRITPPVRSGTERRTWRS